MPRSEVHPGFGIAPLPLCILHPQAAKDVDAVELLGGASRVPRLQAELVKALGGRPLDKCVAASPSWPVLAPEALHACIACHNKPSKLSGACIASRVRLETQPRTYRQPLCQQREDTVLGVRWPETNPSSRSVARLEARKRCRAQAPGRGGGGGPRRRAVRRKPEHDIQAAQVPHVRRRHVSGRLPGATTVQA